MPLTQRDDEQEKGDECAGVLAAWGGSEKLFVIRMEDSGGKSPADFFPEKNRRLPKSYMNSASAASTSQEREGIQFRSEPLSIVDLLRLCKIVTGKAPWPRFFLPFQQASFKDEARRLQWR